MRCLFVVLALLLSGCGGGGANPKHTTEGQDTPEILFTETTTTDGEVLRLKAELVEAEERVAALESVVENLADAVDVRLSELEEAGGLTERMHRCLKEVIYQWDNKSAPACYIF